jgi:hypothetical protein
MRNSLKSGLLAVTALMFTAPLSTLPASATLVAHFVDATFPNNSSLGLGQFDSASITIFVDPSLTNWIAWNNTPTVMPGPVTASPVAFGSSPCSAGEAYVGMCLRGAMDDYVRITVTNPLGAFSSVDYDRNNGVNAPFGAQNVIFGTANAAPDAFRNSFVPGPAGFYYFDEAGAQNALFTTVGNYTFSFSFINEFSGGAFHPDMYLLVDSNPPPPPSNAVPEPITLSLLGAGLAGIGGVRRRRG